MNLPPPPAGLSLGALLRDTTAAVLRRADPARLMSYHPGAGSLGQQAAGAAWLEPCLGPVAAGQVLLTAGAQTALAAILGAVAAPGDRVIVEPLTYPGFRHVAARTGLTLVPCPVDDDGFLPAALDALCREQKPRALYLVPTLQNPTAATTSPARRAEIARIAATHDLWIIEDDPYSRILPEPPVAVAAHAPARTFHVATLAKCLSPGLRIAYLVCPPGDVGAAVADALRAISLMPPPLMAAVATSWIRDGAAEALLAAVRREARARREIARRLLPQAQASADESIHVWLDLPPAWPAERLRAAAEAQGLSLVAADAFATGPGHRNGVRISLGAPESHEVLSTALAAIADLVRQPPGAPPPVMV